MSDRLLGVLRRLDGFLARRSPRVGGALLGALVVVCVYDGLRWGWGYGVHSGLLVGLALMVVLLGTFDPDGR